MNPLKIYLGDLTYDTVALSTEAFPLNIGYIAAYCIERFGSSVDITLFKYIDELDTAIHNNPPDILALGNYCWNQRVGSELFRMLSKLNPNALKIWGGPNFPLDVPSQKEFLIQHPEIDIYVPLEGEIGFTKIIERNTTIPTMKSQVFTTAYDNQDFVSIHVLQGEREMVNDNISLAKFNMVDIPLAPKGVPQIEVSYEVDTDGILHVSAHDLGTDNIQKIVVENSSGLNDEEIDSIINQSQKNKEVDKSKKEYALLKNEAEGLIYSVKKTLSSHGEKIDSETDSRIRSELEVLENELNSEDYNLLNIAFKSLQDVSYKFAQMIYSTKGSNINTEKPATETLSSIDSDEEKNVTE